MTQATGLIVFDMDSTLIQIECIDEIASLTGAGAKVAEITERAMLGQLDFEQSLRKRVKCLSGVSETEFERLFSPIPLTPGAPELVSQLRRLGWKTALVSGGFSWFAQRVAKRLKLDDYQANDLVVVEQRLNGELFGNIVDAQYKAERLRQLQRRWSIPAGQTVAVGDGANDALMLKAADIGIAFCAKPALRAQADYCVDEQDLRRLIPVLTQAGLIPPG
ncbi:MAG: phosphoserine phosphatase SerB [Pseudomonadota bacterium]